MENDEPIKEIILIKSWQGNLKHAKCLKIGFRFKWKMLSKQLLETKGAAIFRTWDMEND